jgi:hypothetical protein
MKPRKQKAEIKNCLKIVIANIIAKNTSTTPTISTTSTLICLNMFYRSWGVDTRSTARDASEVLG